MLVGGIARNFGEHGSSYRLGQGRDFVIEGDEYDSAFFDKTAKFLKYLPDIAVVNNVEFDHADIYAGHRRGDAGVPPARQSRAAARAAAPRRRQSAARGAGRPRACRASRRSAPAPSADWQAHDLEPAGASTRFQVRRDGRAVRQPSRCRSSARTTCATRWRRSPSPPRSGIGAERIADGLRAFAGVKRRLEVVGVADGVTVYDDFAHHPTAVAETLAGLRASNPDGAHLGGVRAALGLVVPARLPGRFRARVRRRRRGADRAGLPLDAARGGAPVGAAAGARSARHAVSRPARPSSIDDIVDAIVDEHRPGDLVVLMSNGGFGGIHQKLLQALA